MKDTLSAKPFLCAAGIAKDYPGARVLEEVSFDVRPGEVHALVGENGAGKSTLMRILSGITPPTVGKMTLDGSPYAPDCRRSAENSGIRMVLQELSLIPTLSIAENIFFEHLPARWGWVRRKPLYEKAHAVMALVGLETMNPATPVEALGVGQQQLVEIARAMAGACRVIILDEPTASLTTGETERLFAQVNRMRAEGIAFVYISHRMDEILRIADRVTILRDGRLVSTQDAAGLTIDEIVRRMVGREIEEVETESLARAGTPALRVEGLCRGDRVQEVSFFVQPGEIVGIAGLMGAGRTEMVRAIFGADRPDRGSIYLNGSETPARIRNPRDAVKSGIALLTEDRKQQGLLLPKSIRENISLARMRSLSSRTGWIKRTAEKGVAADWISRLSIRCSGAEQMAGELSGGNQQKVIMARWLYRDCRILIFDEPTRGIDIGARFEIYKRMRALAAEGKALLVVSSDLKELMGLCDRILVMSVGRITGDFRRGEWTQDALMAAAIRGHLNRAADA